MKSSRSSITFFCIFGASLVYMCHSTESPVKSALLMDNPWLGYYGNPSYGKVSSFSYLQTSTAGQILFLDHKPVPQDGVIYNVSYYGGYSHTARILIYSTSSSGDKILMHESDYVTASQRDVYDGESYSYELEAYWYDIKVERDGQSDEGLYLPVQAGDEIAVQFQNSFNGEYTEGSDCGEEVLVYDGTNYTSLTANDLVSAHYCRDYAFSVAYVPTDACLNYTLQYSYGFCSDGSGGFAYGICGYYITNIYQTYYIGDDVQEFCFLVEADERALDDKIPVVEMDYYDTLPANSYEEENDGETNCNNGGIYTYDGVSGERLVTICGDTELDFWSVWSRERSMKIVYKPSNSSGQQYVHLELYASSKDQVIEGYYESLDGGGGGLPRWALALIGLGGVLVLVAIIAICCACCNSSSKKSVTPTSTTSQNTRTNLATNQARIQSIAKGRSVSQGQLQGQSRGQGQGYSNSYPVQQMQVNPALNAGPSPGAQKSGQLPPISSSTRGNEVPAANHQQPLPSIGHTAHMAPPPPGMAPPSAGMAPPSVPGVAPPSYDTTVGQFGESVPRYEGVPPPAVYQNPPWKADYRHM